MKTKFERSISKSLKDLLARVDKGKKWTKKNTIFEDD